MIFVLRVVVPGCLNDLRVGHLRGLYVGAEDQKGPVRNGGSTRGYPYGGMGLFG